MFEIELGDMLDEVEKSGGTSSDDLWEEERGKFELIRSNTGTTQAGKPKIGFLWKALDGTHEGSTKWENLNVDKDNPRSKREFVGKLLSLGLTKELLKTSPPFEQLPSLVEGTVVVADVVIETWKSGTKVNKFNVVKVVNTDEPASSETAADEGEGDLFGDLS